MEKLMRSRSSSQQSDQPSDFLEYLGVAALGSLAITSLLITGLLVSGGWSDLSSLATVAMMAFEEATDGRQAVYVETSKPSTTHTVQLQDHTVQFYLTNYASEEGPVEMHVIVDQQLQGIFHTFYSYDLWADISPAEYGRQDVNGDRKQDLIIYTGRLPEESYYISSRDGRLRPLEVQHNYPRPR